jgi:hypothetical protein
VLNTRSICCCNRVVYTAVCSSNTVFYVGGSGLCGVLVWMVISWVVVVWVCDVVGWSGVVAVWSGGVCVLVCGVAIVTVVAIVAVGVSVVVVLGGVIVVVFGVVRVGVVVFVGWVVYVWLLSCLGSQEILLVCPPLLHGFLAG